MAPNTETKDEITEFSEIYTSSRNDESPPENNNHQRYKDKSNPNQVVPKAESVKAYLYKVNETKYTCEAVHIDRIEVDEIFLPDLGACVNFDKNHINVFASEQRRNDKLEHEKLEIPTTVDDMEYYNHKEIQIPQDLYEKIKSIAEMQKQLKKNIEELSALKPFMSGAPLTKTKYTNPMVHSSNNI